MIPIGQTQPVKVGLSHANQSQDVAQSHEEKLREMAQKLEASFLAEMLKHAGVGETQSAFGGGVGEEQFASFLRQAKADEIAKAGGIGLAEQLFESLKETSNGTV